MERLKMNRAYWSLIIYVSIAFAAARPANAKTKLDWNPEHTSLFVIGLLEWQHPDIWSSFPACMKNRRDQQLVEYFRDAGVPDERIIYLRDAEATKSRIHKAFQNLLDESDEGELLIFYFCGHGYRDEDTGQTWFANYDAGNKNGSGWSIASIFSQIEKRYQGSRVLLLADCCHSGALYDQVLKHRDSHIKYAALTSSYSHNTSTGNWTFSDCLLAGLRGEAEVDLNGDKFIELDELACYSEFELAFVEGQKAMFTAPNSFPRAAHLAKVEDTLKPGVGQRLEVESGGKWYKAKVIDVDGDQFEVHYVNFDDSWDEWVSHDHIRPYRPSQYAEGDKVEVQWQSDGQWYPATVLKAWYGLELVRYDGYDASSDEWVPSESLRLPTE
jgi:hypothetical protein